MVSKKEEGKEKLCNKERGKTRFKQEVVEFC